ncbi:sensor histidine kinase [Aquimarina sp. MAR_2010_214]|uniref:sensor histidine kinase n=1 Tax=Aquimarina sp. MAR_2010_214 TaxID=1250026 RepID=UPI0013047BBE|nr:histidine kinase [Aquimarina sp. MAR_2010_214]
MKKYLTIILVGFLLGMLTYGFLGFAQEEDNTKLLWLSGLLGVIIAYINTIFNELFNKFISWKKYTGFRLLTGVLSNTIISFLLISIVLYGYTFVKDTPNSFIEDYSEIILKLIILMFFMALVYNVIYFAIHSYYQYAKGQIIALQLERKQTELQLRALKSQLSPHFLFNSMNTISSLVFSDVQKAESFIRELAKSYQYILNKYESKWLTVEEELQFVNSYHFLLQTRFNDRINLEIVLPDWVLKSKIPPLALQMLIENAVKHNQMTSSQILKISITCDNSDICVTNNKTARPEGIDSFKIGLGNIRSRYELIFNRAITVVDDERFTVKLPVII